jgi:hypothetical protein
MTAIRAREEHRTLLDFSNGKYSKTKIKHLLQHCYVSTWEEGRSDVYIENDIKVGMYTIQLHLSLFSWTPSNKLKEFGDFGVSIFDSEKHCIDLKKDKRFRGQYWIENNETGHLRGKQLVDIINHCKRLDRLRAYL